MGNPRLEHEWQAEFVEDPHGLRLTGARRRGRGTWKPAHSLPASVREYLSIEARDGFWYFSGQESTIAELTKVILDNQSGTAVKDKPGRFNFRIEEPARPRMRKIPKEVPAIRCLRDLCNHFGADDARGLNRRIYKDTSCGASISVQTPDGVWHHNGEDWSEIKRIIAFTIQTIVEGSDAEVNSDTFYLPTTKEEVDHWMQDMEAQADVLWDEANKADEDNKIDEQRAQEEQEDVNLSD